MDDYLTARELAELLRIKERKLYDLVADGTIPVTRVTGKLLFPRAAIRDWMRRNTHYGDSLPSSTGVRSLPQIVAGSHDPLLEWALRASGAGLATWMDGSADGIARMKAGEAVAAGIHFHEDGPDSNVARVISEMPGEPVVVIEWARREQGLALAPGIDIADLGALSGMRIIRRQPGSGTEALFRRLMAENGSGIEHLTFADEIARSEGEVAQAVANGRADAGPAIAAAARQFGTGFLPLATERFDLVMRRRDYFEPPLQKLLALTRTAEFAARARELSGYDVSATGTVRYNGP